MTVGDAHVFPGFLTPELTQLSFQSHRPLFSHASAEVRSDNKPETKFVSTGSRPHNQQVTSLTRKPLSHPGGAHIRIVLSSSTLSAIPSTVFVNETLTSAILSVQIYIIM